MENATMDDPMDRLDAEQTREAVRHAYGQVAAGGSGCCGTASCCGGPVGDAEALARTLGYEESDLAALPEGANLGLSCGNPTALAGLKPGEVVLDLGCGGGFDVFIAGRRVGASGRAIGVDMTPEMIARARRNAGAYRRQTGLDNVEFRLGEIENLPVADASVDVILSNCVINLSPDKPRVWREMFRVLRPGGRVAVSDMALLKPLPEIVRERVEALVGCVAGAETVEATRAMEEAAGFDAIQLVSRPEHVATMFKWSDPVFRQLAELFPAGGTPETWITSLEIRAVKP